MKNFFTRPITFEKVEFWLMTIAYLFSLYVITMFLIESLDYNLSVANSYDFRSHKLHFTVFSNYFVPLFLKFTTVYISLVYLSFFLFKDITASRSLWVHIALGGTAVVALIGSHTLIDGFLYKCYYFKDYKPAPHAWKLLLKTNLIYGFLFVIIFISYQLIKHFLSGIKNSLATTKTPKNTLLRDAVVLLLTWLLGLLVFSGNGFPDGPIIIWVTVIAVSIILYIYATGWLLPSVTGKQQGFNTYFLGMVVALLPFLSLNFLYFAVTLHWFQQFVIIGLSNLVVQLLIVTPLSWYIYRNRHSRTMEITGLKTALGTSSANLDLLRSQINPHFLFNALNTLYGTALQEEASRSAEGIQKLGDMMRFMLHENMQETISLTREVDYLQNYIALQKLRTQTSPDILIETEIDEQLNHLQIVPMLLIPFVENAFKHGISLREPSYIKIALHTVGGLLYFDVHNSIHVKSANDPEQYSNGIGLENVKQRLQLLYPETHELTIRETAKEFFVHLTLTLS